MANAFLLAPLAPTGAVSAISTLQAGQAAYAFNDYAGVTVQLACDAGGNGASIRFDLGADTAFDTVLAFGVELLPQTAPQFVMRWATAAQGNFTGSYSQDTSGSCYAGSVLPVSGKGVSMLTLSAPVTARYVQLIWYAASAGQSLRISRIVLGRRFQPAIGFEYGAQFGVRDLGALDVSRRGVLMRSRGKKLRTVSLNFPALTKQEAEGTAQRLMDQVGNTECIGLCTDPTPDPERQNRCYFGPLVGDLSRTWASARGHEVRVNLLGLL